MLHKRRVQFASAASGRTRGIDVDVVQERPDDRIHHGQRRNHVRSHARGAPVDRSAGTVAVVFKHLGDAVKAGDMLALVDAVQVGQAKSQLLQAIVQSRGPQS